MDARTNEELARVDSSAETTELIEKDREAQNLPQDRLKLEDIPRTQVSTKQKEK